ncbi:hypothetical protein RB598_002670 [Gaeumannomyces tritici]
MSSVRSLFWPEPAEEEPRSFGLQQVHPDERNTEATVSKEIESVHSPHLQAPGLFTDTSPPVLQHYCHSWVGGKIFEDMERLEESQNPNSGNVNWLKDDTMLPALIPSARILTYEWNANFVGSASADIFSGHAETLPLRIHAERSRRGRSKYPIIFVTSGFGGLLLAKALVSEVHRRIYADGFKPEVLRYTVGVAFLGTPFRGCEKFASTAAELRLLIAQQTSAETGVLHSSDLVSYLKEGSADNASGLDELVQEFSKLIHDRAFKFPITCFFEGRPTNFEKMLDEMSEAERESLRAKIGSQRVVNQVPTAHLGCRRHSAGLLTPPNFPCRWCLGPPPACRGSMCTNWTHRTA